MRGSVQTCWLPVLGASSQPEPIEILFLLVLHGPTLKYTISDIVFVEIIIIIKEKDTWTVLNQTKCAVTACGPLIHSFWCSVGLKVLGVCDQRKRCICIREPSWLWCLDGAGPEETLPEDERRSLQIFRSLSRSSQLLDPSSPGSGLSFRSVPLPPPPQLCFLLFLGFVLHRSTVWVNCSSSLMTHFVWFSCPGCSARYFVQFCRHSGVTPSATPSRLLLLLSLSLFLSNHFQMCSFFPSPPFFFHLLLWARA